MDENSKANDFIVDDEVLEVENNVSLAIPKKSAFNFFDILKTQTGNGTIENYIDNPLNFNQSKSIAQILRGFSGFVGSLNLAIFDILIGGFNLYKEVKKDV